MLPAFQNSIGQVTHDDVNRTNTVVVTRNRQVDCVWIAIGIDQCNRLDTEIASFANGVLFLVRIDHNDRLRNPVHRADSVQVTVHLAILAIQRRLHFLGVSRQFLATANLFQLFKTTHSAANGSEIRQTTTQPTLSNIRHAATSRFAFDHRAGLSFGSDEQNQTATLGNLLSKFFGSQQTAYGFANINNVNRVLATIDVRSHLGVPAAAAVPKMYARFDQFFDYFIRHCFSKICQANAHGANLETGTPRDQTERVR